MHSATKSNSRRKMRKAMFTADTNQIRIFMSSQLSKELKATHGIRSFPIHSGDIVMVTTGKFKNKEGKVLTVSRQTRKVTVEDCTNPKSSGGSVYYPLDASNLVIKQLFLDEARTKSLEAKKAIVHATRAKYEARAEKK